MAEKSITVGRFQLMYHRSKPMVKIVVIVAILFSMLAVIAMTWVRGNIYDRTAKLRGEAVSLEQEIAELEDRIQKIGSVHSVKQIAEEELDLVDPDTVIFKTE